MHNHIGAKDELPICNKFEVHTFLIHAFPCHRCEQESQQDREVGEITLIERDYMHPIDV